MDSDSVLTLAITTLVDREGIKDFKDTVGVIRLRFTILFLRYAYHSRLSMHFEIY